jgi:hypothetical protein
MKLQIIFGAQYMSHDDVYIGNNTAALLNWTASNGYNVRFRCCGDVSLSFTVYVT